MSSRRRLRRTLALLAAAVALVHLALLGMGRQRAPAAAPPGPVAVSVAAAAPALVAEPAEVPTPVAAPTPAAQAAQAAPVAKPPQRRAQARAASRAPAPAPEPMPVEAPAAPPGGPADVVVADEAAPPVFASESPDDPPPRLMTVAAATPPPQAAAAQAAPPPVYRTRVPGTAKITYKLTRSGISGSGTLEWKTDGASYTLKLEGKLPLVGTLITQVSRGGFDKAGLAPVRFTDKRLSKAEQAANFQRQRGQISFSGPQWELPILAGTQDRLSVMVQLASVAGAWTRPPAAGDQVQVWVVGARGDGDVWTIRYIGRESVRTADGSVVDSLKFLREPSSDHGTRAEFWLDPAKGFLPVRARLTDGSGDALELLRDAAAS